MSTADQTPSMPPCPVCKMAGDHKLSCPEREDGQVRFSTNLPPREPSMPPLPEPFLRLKWERADVYSAEQMHAYAQAATTFQLIQSAPKDGTEIWAFNGEQGRMHWTEGEVAGGKWALWVWADQALAEVDPSPDQPTHWMPLPPVPTLSLDPSKGASP